CERQSLANCDKVVDTILSRLTQSDKLQLESGAETVVLLNNLGSTSQIELNILSGAVLQWMRQHFFRVSRFFCGTVMTSLDGHGISISVLKVHDPKWLSALDAECDAPGWRNVQAIPNDNIRLTAITHAEVKLPVLGVEIDETYAQKIKNCLHAAVTSLIASESELNLLDSRAGDGDCGSTMAVAANAIETAIRNGSLHFERPQTCLLQLSTIFENEVGGTTGALYALMLSASCSCLSSGATSVDWYNALKTGLEAVMKYGHAVPGYRTMVDPLHAAVSAYDASVSTKPDWHKLLSYAETAAQNTKFMRAQCGRASYTSSSVQTEPDPGAVAVTKWMRAIHDKAFADN
ncbi:hypothetical protein AB6A40_003367, partial [Gnathostoma spinigerum]